MTCRNMDLVRGTAGRSTLSSRYGMGDAGSVWFGHSTVACPHATYGQQQGGHWQRHPISEVVVTLWRSIIFTQRLFETPSRCTMCHAAEKNCIGTRQFKVCEGFLTCRRAHRHTGIAYWCTRPKAKAVPSPQRRRPSLAPATSEPASPVRDCRKLAGTSSYTANFI